MTYQKFKEKYLIQDFRDNRGKPKHTRYYKKYFYIFRNQLLKEFGPQLDIYFCSNSDCQFHTTFIHCGKPVIMELDHINRITNDARPENLRSLCSLCHSQTNGYKNRKTSIDEYHQKLMKLQLLN